MFFLNDYSPPFGDEVSLLAVTLLIPEYRNQKGYSGITLSGQINGIKILAINKSSLSGRQAYGVNNQQIK
ncbi:MAG: hypothetical protein U9N53_12160 [Bacteroidota bacterium]|nr:hypothetical protein [Bacteroidota bacterium]